jgi:hypothetical protein
LDLGGNNAGQGFDFGLELPAFPRRKLVHKIGEPGGLAGP